jgi:hypothetical protein
MKLHTAIAAAFLSVGISQGAMTLQFASTTSVLTNLQNSAGQTNQTLVWGIVVDTTGNGFASGSYLPGFNVSDNGAANSPNGQFLSTAGGVSDDLLFISTNLMTLSGTGDNSAGFARPTNLVGLNYVNGVTQNDAFALIWFDLTTKTGQVAAEGSKYGMLTDPGLILPADAGSSVSFAPLFLGPDPARPANLTFGVIPEPSTALLGLLGVLGLVRRRR